MEDVLMEIIARVQDEKKANRVAPVNALFIADIMPAINDAVKLTLNKLVKDGMVEWHRTINDDSFRINETIE